MLNRLPIMVLLVAATVYSANAGAAERWYSVEVIVFRHAPETIQADNEQWPVLESVPDYRGSQEIVVDLGDFNEPAESDRPNEVQIPGPRPFEALARRELKMAGVFRTLRNSSSHEPVLHVGWRQPGLGDNRARSVYISDRPAKPLSSDQELGALQSLDRPIEIARIEGTIRVRTGRLLFVTADFVNYTAQVPTRIRERRRVKLKELHYFDHPLFGVIVQVTPYRFAQPEQEDGAQTARLQ